MKWCRRSKFRSGWLLLLAAALTPVGALAQPCCATASALFPTRLSGEERLVLGVVAGARDDYGSFDGAGRFVSAPRGDSEQTFEQRLMAAAAPARRLQVAA